MIDRSKFHFIKCLIWVKNNKIMGQTYMNQFEYIIMLRKGPHKKINNCGTSDVLSIPNNKHKYISGENIHDTEKPVDLFKILIENSSKERDIVLDPFCGIGPCLVACKELNRKFVGIDIESKYIHIAKQYVKNGNLTNI